MSAKYSVVPVSPKTGRIVKSPRKGQKVVFAVKGPRGGLSVIRKEPQKFFKTDLKSLNKIVSDSKKKNFVVYEQKMRTLDRDKEGNIQYRTDSRGKEHKVYETKITGAKPRAKTKPLLYSSGKKVRQLDLAYRKGNYQKQKYIRDLVLIKPNARIHEQVLKGRTIKDALSNIQLDLTTKRKKGFGVYYNIFVTIDTPEGERIKVPVNSSFRDGEFERSNRFPVKGQDELFGRSEVKLLENLTNDMSKSIRYAFKNTGDGYTFTSLAVLEQIESRKKKEYAEAIADLENEKAKLNRAIDMGDEELIEKFEKSVENKDRKAAGIRKAIAGLWFDNQKKRYFINKKTRLEPIDSSYRVTMYVKFEYMYE